MSLFHDIFDATAQRWPENRALQYRGRGYSYRELYERSVRLAAGLQSLGLRRGERVAIYLQNRPETVEMALACSRAGAIFVPANPMLKSRQLGYMLRDCGARILVGSAASAIPMHELSESCPELQVLVLCDFGNGGSTTRLLHASYDDLLRAQPDTQRSSAIDEDPAALLYTSGSTGRPKGVVVSHRNLVAGAASVSQYLHNRADDRILAALPLSFDYGFSQVSTAFAVGACAVLSSFALPAAVLQEVAAERITGLAGVPTMWMNLAALEWPSAAVQTLRYITNSGGALPAPVVRALQARLPRTRIYCMYGLTEAFRSTYLEPEQLEQRLGSIGKAIPDQEVMVLRPDGSRCAPGEAGELVHRGSLVTLGYWNDPQATQQRFRPLPAQLLGVPRAEIAVWSGDLVRTDEEGYLYFVSRADHLIKSSGYRISPTEIEEVVMEVPGVIEAAAAGVPDKVLGQRVAIGVVALAPASDLVESIRQHCRMQLAPYMVPAEIRLLERIPRNVNGKCDREALARIFSGDVQAAAES